MDKKLIILSDMSKEISSLGKKIFQKIMYLMERHGINLNLNYSIHFYGPYSAKLDNWLHEYESYGLLTIDTSKTTHSISLCQSIDAKLDEQDLSIEKYVLEIYKNFSALDLEAITTLDYVGHVMYKDTADREKVIDMVKVIKGTKFSDEDLNKKYEILLSNGLVK